MAKIIVFLKKDLSRSFRLEKPKKKKKKKKKKKERSPAWNRSGLVIGLMILFVFLLGFLQGTFWGNNFFKETESLFSKLKLRSPLAEKQAQGSDSTLFQPQSPPQYVPQTTQEEAVIKVVREVSPAVVSIIISKDMPVFERYYENPFKEFFGQDLPFEIEIPKYRQKGTERKKIGGGTGFIISEEGMILTNKHVVVDELADYTILTNDGQRFAAKVLARDPFQDLAVLKIEREKVITKQGRFLAKPFKTVRLGDSSRLQIGQTVVAIGNALGEFRNTVSVGVISGLGRTVTASGGGIIETLEDVIQTDAAINKGNSGGPLLNLRGEVIGVNVAMAQGAQSIGFSIPINKAKTAIEQIKTIGKIVYPFLGVRYILITPEIQEERGLSVDYGALIIKGDRPGEVAVVPDTAADKAGLRESDIILEVDGEKITPEHSLAKIIRARKPGDKVSLKVLRGKKEIILQAILGEKTS